MRVCVISTKKNDSENIDVLNQIAFVGELKKDTKVDVDIFVLGSINQERIKQFTRFPVNRIISMDAEEFDQYIPEAYLMALEYLVRKYDMDIIVFSGDMVGRELSARLAQRIDGACINDCINIEFLNEKLLITKPVYSGNMYSKMEVTAKKCVVSIRSGVFERYDTGVTGMCPVIHESMKFGNICSWVSEREIVKLEKDKLKDADIVIVGGKGVGNKDDFGLLETLAQKIGGQVAGTRPAVMQGWLDINRLVGQSGKILSPMLCIVIGASGATPFITGVSSAKKIIAINKDKNALIFKSCHIGVVAEYKEILKKIIEMFD